MAHADGAEVLVTGPTAVGNLTIWPFWLWVLAASTVMLVQTQKTPASNDADQESKSASYVA